MEKYKAIDIFSGCGGMTKGMRMAGFDVRVAVEINEDATNAYKMNHPKTNIIQRDIRKVKSKEIKNLLNKQRPALLSGCPPCQGFSSIRRLNKKRSVRDDRNELILEYLRMVRELKPLTIMMENVPGLINYYLFKKTISEIRDMGYYLDIDIVNTKDYGIPQRRRRLVLLGSKLGNIKIAQPTYKIKTVKDTIGKLESIELATDPWQRVTTKHTERIRNIISLIPKNGGSLKDLPHEYQLKCHMAPNRGFDDIYGRMKWEECSPTITAGCLNPSKGRFLHPQEDRVITPREAALLQCFPIKYKFPLEVSKTSIAWMIGEALPPKFSFIQCKNIKEHLDNYFGR
jgi:DNA (cytosine-5)-methyltransferase 1